MILVDRLIYGGLRFIFNQIAAAVDQEMDDEGLLKEELLTSQMRLELGEIDEEEFAAIEAEILPRLREIRQRREGRSGSVGGGGGPASGGRVVGVEVDFGGDAEDRSGGGR